MSGAARRATTKPDGAESRSAEERLQGYWAQSCGWSTPAASNAAGEGRALGHVGRENRRMGRWLQTCAGTH
jgi:hypothetical protein